MSDLKEYLGVYPRLLEAGVSDRVARLCVWIASLARISDDELEHIVDVLEGMRDKDAIDTYAYHAFVSHGFALMPVTSAYIADALGMDPTAVARAMRDGRIAADKRGGVWVSTFGDVVDALLSGALRPRWQSGGDDDGGQVSET